MCKDRLSVNFCCGYSCRCKEVNSYTFYPWVHQFCNNMAAKDQMQAIQFPDVNPCDLPLNANFSMAAGDFLEVYVDPGKSGLLFPIIIEYAGLWIDS